MNKDSQPASGAYRDVVLWLNPDAKFDYTSNIAKQNPSKKRRQERIGTSNSLRDPLKLKRTNLGIAQRRSLSRAGRTETRLSRGNSQSSSQAASRSTTPSSMTTGSTQSTTSSSVFGNSSANPPPTINTSRSSTPRPIESQDTSTSRSSTPRPMAGQRTPTWHHTPPETCQPLGSHG